MTPPLTALLADCPCRERRYVRRSSPERSERGEHLLCCFLACSCRLYMCVRVCVCECIAESKQATLLQAQALDLDTAAHFLAAALGWHMIKQTHINWNGSVGLL